MTINIKLSWLEKHHEKKIEKVMWTYFKKINKIKTIFLTAREFNIPISDISKNVALEKIAFYRKQIDKIHDYLNWKYNDSYKGELRFKTIESCSLDRYMWHSEIEL